MLHGALQIVIFPSLPILVCQLVFPNLPEQLAEDGRLGRRPPSEKDASGQGGQSRTLRG